MAEPDPDPLLDTDAKLEAALAEFLEQELGSERSDRSGLQSAEAAEFLAQHDRLREFGRWWREASGLTIRSGGPTVSGSAGSGLWSSTPGLPRIPGYEISREIARGGMGVVYEARQTSLDRPVAIKLILYGAIAGEDERRRFATEAAAAAKLKHPNIVVIHEVGEFDGQPFFSMEYVEGESLAKLLTRGLPTQLQVVEYMRQIATAVQFAHDHGVMHRDLKPSNVLVDSTGRVRVMDFGLAKQIDADERLTVTGQLLGTPSYMAPEQITGPASEVGTSCDVYGLGAVLFELLTGQPPFRGANHMETLLQVVEADPPLPRQLNPHVPRPLEMIALKCLEKKPENRYPSAGAVAADLERFVQGESLSVSSPNLLDRLVRTLERSQFDRDIRSASRFVFHTSWLALVTHAAIFLNYLLRMPHPVWGVVGIRASELLVMAAVFWPHRRDWFPPRGAGARQLWSIWLGYLVGTQVLVAIDYLLSPPGQPYYSLSAYPSLAVLSSLVFMVLGSSYWGYCYVIAGVFMFMALVLTQWLAAAPLVFGLSWSICLVWLGRRLAELATEAAGE